MAFGSKNLTPEQLRGLEDEPLADALAEAKKELFNLRFQTATGQLESHGRLRAVRKDIARIYTEMRERELGIGRDAAEQAEDTNDTTTEKVG
ncbi:50S ribosomal protein L29 [Ornithinicoccus hortensis]|uniref:Large ribosomal subunit protein uL29 n=1 Tax=Ornithinicoccus hortensis TaxID=82346 RepID=A0A542YPI8_9MICO|nr:50S ribosomal protein L29 [Ornithinicoccus hortensis]TQL50022.1 LSU ribosomal protein L29P [Ornithinicoccus hortensis]